MQPSSLMRLRRYSSTLANLLHRPFLVILVNEGAIGIHGGGVRLDYNSSMEAACATPNTGKIVLGINRDFYRVLGATGAEQKLRERPPYDLFFFLPSSSHGRIS